MYVPEFNYIVLALNGSTHPHVCKHSKHGCMLSECDNRPGLEQTVIIARSDTYFYYRFIT